MEGTVGWRDRMRVVVGRLVLAPAETSGIGTSRTDRAGRVAFEFEMIREQGRPLDY